MSENLESIIVIIICIGIVIFPFLALFTIVRTMGKKK